MKKLLIPILCGLLSGTLSCSKPAAPPPNPTPAPAAPAATAVSPSAAIPIDLEPTATPEPLEYVLEDLKGTVLIRESGETATRPADEEEMVGEGDEIITKAGSEASLTLDENTMFHLSENSDVKVDELKPNTSNGFISRLLLAGGRLLSEVEKLGDGHSTFEVESGGVVCGVRGTAFEVFNQGGAVHTLTYHGTVEMRKGDLVQSVVAGHHSAFLVRKGVFQRPRPLKANEQQHYQNWLRKKAVVRQKQAQRLEAVRSLSNLPPEQRNRVMESLKGAKPRDRMRLMHQMLKPGARPPAGAGAKPAPERPRPGSLQGKARNRLNENRLPNKGVGIRGKAPPASSLKPKGKNQGALHPNQAQGPKHLLRPQGQQSRPVLRPNRPAQNKPLNRPKIQPRKPGKPQPNGQKKDRKKKGKENQQ
jgi:hypothetical protein